MLNFMINTDITPEEGFLKAMTLEREEGKAVDAGTIEMAPIALRQKG
jgi:hypothetical protein